MEKGNDRAVSTAPAKSQLVTPVGQLTAGDKKAYCGIWIPGDGRLRVLDLAVRLVAQEAVGSNIFSETVCERGTFSWCTFL